MRSFDHQQPGPGRSQGKIAGGHGLSVAGPQVTDPTPEPHSYGHFAVGPLAVGAAGPGGGSLPGSRAGAGLPALLALDIAHSDLLDLYARATVYWHTTAHGEDETRDPAAGERRLLELVNAVAPEIPRPSPG